MKQIRSVYTNNLTYTVDLGTRVVTHRQVEVSRDETEQVLKIIDSRIKSASAKRLRDATFRSLGMIKVKGAISGSTYWE